MSDASANKVILLGRVGKKGAFLRKTPSGESVISFSISTGDQWIDKKSGEKKETLQWHTIEAWRELAELCSKYLKGGSRVYLEGKLVYGMEEKDGVKRKWAKIKLSEVQFL